MPKISALIKSVAETRHSISYTALCLAVWTAAGCHPYGNAYRDEMTPQSAVTTPSVDGIRASGAEHSLPHREVEESIVQWEPVAVAHAPLYFEDPYETKGSEDGKIEWTSEDYLGIVYGPTRFLVNGLLFPISAIVDVPWKVQESDGEIPSDPPVTCRELLGSRTAFDPAKPAKPAASNSSQ